MHSLAMAQVCPGGQKAPKLSSATSRARAGQTQKPSELAVACSTQEPQPDKKGFFSLWRKQVRILLLDQDQGQDQGLVSSRGHCH